MNGFELDRSIVAFHEANTGRYPNRRAVLIPVLMECQKRYGHVSPEVSAAVSELTRVPQAEVESVVSFYTMLLDRPVGKYVIGVCCTWNCEHGGANAIATHFEDKYGVKRGETTSDGMFTMLNVECLADCHNAPSAQFLRIGEFGAWWVNNLTVEIFEQILADLAAGKEDALRERLVRLEDKQNPPDDKKWVWIVTTNNQYPAWIEDSGAEITVHDGYGRLGGLRDSNPALYQEIKSALVRN